MGTPARRPLSAAFPQVASPSRSRRRRRPCTARLPATRWRPLVEGASDPKPAACTPAPVTAALSASAGSGGRQDDGSPLRPLGDLCSLRKVTAQVDEPKATGPMGIPAHRSLIAGVLSGRDAVAAPTLHTPQAPERPQRLATRSPPRGSQPARRPASPPARRLRSGHEKARRVHPGGPRFSAFALCAAFRRSGHFRCVWSLSRSSRERFEYSLNSLSMRSVSSSSMRWRSLLPR